MILKYTYILTALLFILFVAIGKLFIFNKKDASFISDYCAGIAMSMVIYIILSMVFVFILPDIYSKVLMLFFAMSPFIIGLMATYHTEKFFTVLQILIVGASAFYLI